MAKLPIPSKNDFMLRAMNSILAAANHRAATQRNINNDKKGQEHRDMLRGALRGHAAQER
jgi:hypothetical protein